MFKSKPIDNNSNTLFPLSDLPLEIRQETYSCTPLSMLGLLAQTSKQFNEETVFLRLLAASIHAAPEFMDAKKDPTALAAIAILKKHPDLLFRKKIVIDHHGRKIFASPYQIFFGAGDIWALKQIQNDIFPLIKNGEKQAEAQFKEQFPNCPWPLPENFSEEMLYDNRNIQQIEAITEQLVIVKQHIMADLFTNKKPLDTTKFAVATLCELFQPKPGEIIRSGLHFPLGIMNEIYKTYNALQNHQAFFTLAVIKPALDALSTVDGQCCQDGLRKLDMENGPSRRCHSSYQHPLGKPLSLTFVNHKRDTAALVDPDDGEVHFATDPPDYFYCYNKYGSLAPRGRNGDLGQLSGLWKTYGEKKQQFMKAHAPTEKSTHCRNGRERSRNGVVL